MQTPLERFAFYLMAFWLGLISRLWYGPLWLFDKIYMRQMDASHKLMMKIKTTSPRLWKVTKPFFGAHIWVNEKIYNKFYAIDEDDKL